MGKINLSRGLWKSQIRVLEEYCARKGWEVEYVSRKDPNADSDFQRFMLVFVCDLMMVSMLFRTAWIFQSTLLSQGIAFLCFLGVFIPIYLIILKIHEQDYLFGQDSLIYMIYTGVFFVFIKLDSPRFTLWIKLVCYISL